MGLTKITNISDGLYADSDGYLVPGIIKLASNAALVPGQVLLRDSTQTVSNNLPVNQPGWNVYTPQGDVYVLPSSANGGDVAGVYQGPVYVNTSGAQQNYSTALIMKIGIGKVLVGSIATTGVQVRVGDALIVNGTNNFAVAGTRAFGTTVGRVVATNIAAVGTPVISAVAATGSQTVTVSLPGLNANYTQQYVTAGITTATPITVDTGAAYEVVTPTAVTATGFTAVFANTHPANTPIGGNSTAVNTVILPANTTGTPTQAIVLADINVA